jgi:tRNA U54 and U55 pseudouridine synthase Pus10
VAAAAAASPATAATTPAASTTTPKSTGGKACLHACHENREGHECAFCHLAFDTNEKCHDEILADLKELKAELAV